MPKNMLKKNYCVVVPAYNEEKVISSSLSALKKIVSSDRIFVVSDGSTDKTFQLALQSGVNTMGLRKNAGKAGAILKLIKSRKLTSSYKYVLFSDADSRLDKNFSKNIRTYLKEKPACLVATVKSDRHGFVSAFRTYEYCVTHLIYKNSQNVTNTIMVAPGCASLYRSDVLEKLDFTNGTLTEDFDLTLQIHRRKLGQIIYVSQAKVVTQDPPTLRDYWCQVVRWYTGFWQNIFLHRLYLPVGKINLETLLIILDAFLAIAALSYFSFHPLLLLKVLILMVIFIIASGIIVLLLLRQFWSLIYVPLFPVLYFVNLSAYITGFFRALFIKKNILSWKKISRYYVKA